MENGQRYFGYVIMASVIVLPMAWVIGYSLLYSLGGIGYFSEGWTIKYWMAACSVGGLPQSLLFSVGLSLAIVLASAAFALTWTLCFPATRDHRILLAMFSIPMATPAIVAAIIVFQTLSPGGAVARVAYHLGVLRSPSQFPVLVNDTRGIGIVLAGVFCTFPLLTLFFLKTWGNARIDRYCELATALNASPWNAKLRVALPMLLRRGRMLILLAFLANLGSYEIPLLLGSQSPQMFSVLTQRRFGQFELSQRPQAFAMATTYFAITGTGLWLLLAWRPSHA